MGLAVQYRWSVCSQEHAIKVQNVSIFSLYDCLYNIVDCEFEF